MTEDRLINLYEHSRRSIFELKAERHMILTGSMPVTREELQIRVNAISRLIRKMDKDGSQ